MDTRKYKVLLSVVDLGSFTKASEELGYTVSGISHMMNSLEEEIGFKILFRSKKGVTLSHDGAELLPILRSIIKLEEKYEQTLSEIHDLNQGTIHIGSYPSVANHWLPKIIKQFNQQYPKIKIKITEGVNQEIMRLLDEKRVDVGFASSQNTQNYTWIPLGTDPMIAVLPLDHPKANDKYYDLKDVEIDDFIVTAGGNDEDVSNLLRKYSLTPKIGYQTFENYSALAMIEEGLGMSVMNELITKGRNVNLAKKPLNPPAFIELGILLPKDIVTPAVTKFVDYTKKYFQENPVI
ncbi:LysR family transcriptional regulator [Enterococcus sp. ALS3]|uniref:LysR family transcriptional regulator n=1 Tax=Enterococcus alishanensis TaxID=1303817 RepID=A0ABS6TC03_9ENTE|nr:LysR family transcriptional regulator [Enterococcus alishanensis]MBV7390439.1 LysR family transcriptional regulator [Enterococcus alishanensis]